MQDRNGTDVRGTFLGFRMSELVAIVALVIVATIVAFPFMSTSCGTVVENGTRMAAACMSDDELRETMDRIHAERSGRMWEDGR